MVPCQPIPKHSLGRGVGLVALDWQDQLLAQPCPSPQGCPPPGLSAPRPCLFPVAASRGGAGIHEV